MAKRQQLLFELVYKEKEQATKQTSPVGGAITAQKPTAEKKQLYLKLNLFGIILSAVALFVIFFCGYVLGYHSGKKSAVAHRSETQLAEIQKQPPQTEVLKVAPVKPLPVQKTVPVPPIKSSVVKTVAQKKSQNNYKFNRKKGVNYLIIQLFKDYQSAEHARKFLADNGVNATIEKLNRWYALTSVAGFDLRDAEGKRQADAFREQIKALGRRYRRLKEANGVDFQTCFYRKWK